MVAKGAVITHGSNAVRYSSEKDKAEIVKVNHLPVNDNVKVYQQIIQ
jgi:hypothetical protein